MDDIVPTIKAENVQPGMILQFAGTATVRLDSGEDVALWEAEIASVEQPDGFADWGFWVTPDGAHTEFFVWADEDRHYPIIG